MHQIISTIVGMPISDRSLDRDPISRPGSVAWLDWADRELVDGTFYAIDVGGEQMVRCFVEPGQFVANSSKPFPLIGADKAVVLGRVVGFSIDSAACRARAEP